MGKARVKAEVRVNVYAVIADAIESGVRYGWGRAHKHTDSPNEETILSSIEDAVMNNLCEVLMFGADQ